MKQLLILLIFSSHLFAQSMIEHSSCRVWIAETNIRLTLDRNGNELLNTKITEVLKNKNYKLLNTPSRKSWFKLQNDSFFKSWQKDDFYISIIDHKNHIQGALFDLGDYQKKISTPLLIRKVAQDKYHRYGYEQGSDNSHREAIFKFVQEIPICKVVNLKSEPKKPVFQLVKEKEENVFKHSSCRTWIFDSEHLRNSKIINKERRKILYDKGYKVINQFKEFSRLRLLGGNDIIARNDIIIPIITDKIDRTVHAEIFPYINVRSRGFLDTYVNWTRNENLTYQTKKVKFKRARNIKNQAAIDKTIAHLPKCIATSQGFDPNSKEQKHDYKIRSFEMKTCINNHKDYLAKNGKNKAISDSLLVLEELYQCDRDTFEGRECLAKDYRDFLTLTPRNNKIVDKMLLRMGVAELARQVGNYVTYQEICSDRENSIHQKDIFNIIKKARMGY